MPNSNATHTPSAGNGAPPRAALDAKVLRLLEGRVILKPLTRWNEAYREFPRFVLEYLVSRYVQADDPLPGQRKIDRILSEHYTESSKKELIKSAIKEKGEYTLLGQLVVRLEAGKDHYWADVPALGENTVRVSQKVLTQFGEILLTSGAWGTMTVEYDATYEIKSRKYPFYIREFTPFQVTRLDLDEYISKRPLFDDDEWLDLLVQTVGFNPANLDRRTKWLMLLRLVPFVESNYNLMELGPQQTGKTFTYRNTSSRAFVVSGGKATPATLFYHGAAKRLGVVATKHVVYFDEISKTKFEDAEASISTFKDYMQTGIFTRMGQEFRASASIVLGGNIEVVLEEKRPSRKYPHLFAVLPVELQDTAFLDRLHGYLPGWEIPVINPMNYAPGYGFMSDYFAEILAEFRRRNYQTHVAAQLTFRGMNQRNEDAVKKTVAGMLKLLYPHYAPGEVPAALLEEVLAFAVEMRKRVTDQLAVMKPDEFENACFQSAVNG
ncbi:MAG TPA: BREX system Lon protease-like protein BrxL [Pirellulales bacterium]|nr:BREX system Lon protease-like protein BrxL [Pirellulales bacterium]